MAKKKTEDPIEGELIQDQVVEETATEETTIEQLVVAEEVVAEEVVAEEVVIEEAKPEKPMQIGSDGNPILPAEEHVKNWGKMTKVPFGQKDELSESE